MSRTDAENATTIFALQLFDVAQKERQALEVGQCLQRAVDGGQLLTRCDHALDVVGGRGSQERRVIAAVGGAGGAAAEVVDDLVRQDADDPGAQRRPPGEAAGLGDGGQERLLRQIARELAVAGGAQREAMQDRHELA